MDNGPEASRATKFTFLATCSANELVHRRLGVLRKTVHFEAGCQCEKSVANGPEASRATKFTYLATCSANGLVHRRLGVFCTILAPVYSGKRCILRRHGKSDKAWLTDRKPRCCNFFLTMCVYIPSLQPVPRDGGLQGGGPIFGVFVLYACKTYLFMFMNKKLPQRGVALEERAERNQGGEYTLTLLQCRHPDAVKPRTRRSTSQLLVYAR